MEAGTERDEPLTPYGRLYFQPEMYQIIHCVVGVKNPIDIDAVKAEISNSGMFPHPRFNSLLVTDSSGREHWRKTEVNADQHIIVRHEPLSDDPTNTDDGAVNDYLADLSVSCPLSIDKPLWEIHFLMAHNCAVIRVHHAIGDGISLMSMFLSLCRRVDDPSQPPTIDGVGASVRRRRWSLWKGLKMVWYTCVFGVESTLRSLWLKDKRSVVSGGAGVELLPRKLATAKFSLDDMKLVKKAIAKATINDVLLGIISYGFYKYLNHRSPEALQEKIQITGLCMVNIRSQLGLQDFSKLMENKSRNRWGNMFGMVLLPLSYHKGGVDPLQFLKRAKEMMDKKKLSLEAISSYKIGNFAMSNFRAKFASLLSYKVVCNTTFSISNIVGPQEEIAIAGNPITYIRVNASSLPHAITMHMVSYGGRADLQILVAKDIIPDVEVLAKCFEDALLEMKEVVAINKG